MATFEGRFEKGKFSWWTWGSLGSFGHAHSLFKEQHFFGDL